MEQSLPRRFDRRPLLEGVIAEQNLVSLDRFSFFAARRLLAEAAANTPDSPGEAQEFYAMLKKKARGKRDQAATFEIGSKGTERRLRNSIVKSQIRNSLIDRLCLGL